MTHYKKKAIDDTVVNHLRVATMQKVKIQTLSKIITLSLFRGAGPCRDVRYGYRRPS